MWLGEMFADRVALREPSGMALTYRDLKKESKIFLDKVHCVSCGDEPETGSVRSEKPLLFSLSNNTIGSVLGYVSCLEGDLAVLLLDQKMDGDRLLYLLGLYHPSFLWLPLEKTAQFSRWERVHEAFGFVLLHQAQPEQHRVHTDLRLLLSTSGSTGSPRLVRLSLENIQSNAWSIAQYLGITEYERAITTLPMHYAYGLSVINSHLMRGATILLTDHSLMNRDFWDFFRSYEATSLAGVPYHYGLLKKMGFLDWSLPSLKTLTQAGGRLDLALQEDFARYAREHDLAFFIMYGQTEATARMSYLDPKLASVKRGSIGRPIPGGSFVLVDAEHRLIDGPAVTGELVYRGPNVSLGYAEKREDLALGDECQGVLYTGDLAKRDQDGCYYIVGRKKRFIKIFGKRINLDELEVLLREKTGVSDCFCLGEDDLLYVVLTDMAKEALVGAYLQERLCLGKTVFKIKLVQRIPLLPSGKIDRVALMTLVMGSEQGR